MGTLSFAWPSYFIIKSKLYPKFNEFRCLGCNGCLNLCPSDAIWAHSSKKHHQYDQYKEMILNN